MVHTLFVAEGFYDQIQKFLEYFNGKEYANGKAKVRARVIMPIHFGINEIGYDEFLADLKSFTMTGKFNTKNGVWKNTEETGQGLKNKLHFFIKLFRKLFPQIKDIEQDIIKVNSSNMKKKLEKIGNHFIMCLYPIGKINDARYPNGSEVV